MHVEKVDVRVDVLESVQLRCGVLAHVNPGREQEHRFRQREVAVAEVARKREDEVPACAVAREEDLRWLHAALYREVDVHAQAVEQRGREGRRLDFAVVDGKDVRDGCERENSARDC